MMCVSAVSLLAAPPPPNNLLEISAAAVLVKFATYADWCTRFSYAIQSEWATLSHVPESSESVAFRVQNLGNTR